MLATLKKIRKEKKYTISDMSKFLNISKSYYSQIENEDRKLHYNMEVMISLIFPMKPDEIFYSDFKNSKVKFKSDKIKTIVVNPPSE